MENIRTVSFCAPNIGEINFRHSGQICKRQHELARKVAPAPHSSDRGVEYVGFPACLCNGLPTSSVIAGFRGRNFYGRFDRCHLGARRHRRRSFAALGDQTPYPRSEYVGFWWRAAMAWRVPDVRFYPPGRGRRPCRCTGAALGSAPTLPHGGRRASPCRCYFFASPCCSPA